MTIVRQLLAVALVSLCMDSATAEPASALALRSLEETLFRLLDASLIAYKTGNEVSGAHLLHAFQDSIFKQ